MDLEFAPFMTMLFVSSLGLALFVFGKRTTRAPQMATGLVLMVLPYFLDGVLLNLGVAALLVGVMALVIRWGW